MRKRCYTIVSDIALCQKCPVLLAYKLHMGMQTAWRVGIKSNGYAYGSIFHEKIAQVFFEAAANPRHVLHYQAIRAVTGGYRAIDDFIRERIFIPFVNANSKKLTSGQITSLASGVSTWVRAMAEFFREIPSLIITPKITVPRVFMKPEQRLQAEYIFPSLDVNNENSLVVTGCYDALLFNPDKVEARLFEFKGYNKSDIVVPLTQSLVYSWLIERTIGIMPSVEIIYLDERSRDPDVFDSKTVREMIGLGLKSLLASVFNVITLKKFPAVNFNKSLCSVCKFSRRCRQDVASGFKFRKRPGISLVNVMVFLIFSVMVTAQIFFYSVNSSESVIESREIMRVRLTLEDMIRKARETSYLNKAKPIKKGEVTHETFYTDSPKNFYDLKADSSANVPSTVSGVDIHNLYYQYEPEAINIISGKAKYWTQEAYKRIFDQMPEHYLIRAYAPVANGRNLMIQVVVNSSGVIKSRQEVWY
ncbi:MAG: PD-(D/E)XK nuclease family protein [Synergistaceae bacterium]|nr:PD-(D/E)XK nuclease family protein [Synergistaceae bacterium]